MKLEGAGQNSRAFYPFGIGYIGPESGGRSGQSSGELREGRGEMSNFVAKRRTKSGRKRAKSIV